MRKVIFLTLIIMLILGSTFSYKIRAYANTGMKFSKKASYVKVGEKYKFRLAKKPKKKNIRFFSNKKSIASIGKKNGVLKAKKKGTVTISAHAKVQGKNKKAKTKVRIISSESTIDNNHLTVLNTQVKTVLPDVNFEISGNINPWNHSIQLYSSRVLLENEVDSSSLTLTSVVNKTAPLKADFKHLSNDGKTVTYTLSSESARKICTGKGMASGKYQVTSPIYEGNKYTNFTERLSGGTIAGFVTDINGKGLSDACVIIYNAGQKEIISCLTDDDGYYSFDDIETGEYYICAEKKEYHTPDKKNITISDLPLCENFLMHSETEDGSLSVTCTVNDYPDTDFYVYANDNLVTSGKTDSLGMFTLAGNNYRSDNSDKSIDSFDNVSHFTELTCELDISNELTNPVIKKTAYPHSKDSIYYTDLLNPCENIKLCIGAYEICLNAENILSNNIYLNIKSKTTHVITSCNLDINTADTYITDNNLTLSLYDGDTLLSTGSIYIDKSGHSGDIKESDFFKNIIKQKIKSNNENYILLVRLNEKILGIYNARVNEETLNIGNITLSKTGKCKALVFGEFSSDYGKDILLNIYIKKSGFKFFLNQISIDEMEMVSDNGCKKYITIDGISPEYEYFIESEKHDIFVLSDETFRLNINEIYDDINNNTVATLQIILSITGSESKTPTADISQDTKQNVVSNKTILYIPDGAFTDSDTYPNTFFLCYDYNGNRIGKIFNNKHFTYPTSDNYFFDVFLSGSHIYTTQKSYSESSVFLST